MPYTQEGFILALDQLTDATNGINEIVVLTDVFDNLYNLISATVTEYNAATTKVELTTTIDSPVGNDVETVLESTGGQNWTDFIDVGGAGQWTDATIIRIDDGTSYTYWKAYYLTTQSITFGSATASELGGSVSVTNVPLTFNITGGQLVQAVAFYHDYTKICYDEIDDVTDVNDFSYQITSAILRDGD